MVKKNEILEITGKEEKLPGDQNEEQPEKKRGLFISTSSRPQPKKKIATLTTHDLDAAGKLIKKREANDE